MIVAQMTEDEEVIAAAYLHDVLEDTAVTAEQLEKEFGGRVLALVSAETEDKSLSWRERKQAAIEHLKTASREEKILVLGDKLSNMRSTARDYMAEGEHVWQRFNEKRRECHQWYMAGMLEGLVGFFTNKQQLLLGASGFMFMFISVGFATWTNKYVQSIGFSPVQGGMIITCYSIAGIIASCLSGSIAQKLHMSHRNFLMMTLAGMGVMTIIFSMQRSYTGLILIGIIYGAVSYLPSTHYTTSAMMLAGERFTATAASTQNLLFQMASLIMPIIVGRVIDATGSYSFVWYIFVGCAAVAVFFSFLVKNDERP